MAGDHKFFDPPCMGLVGARLAGQRKLYGCPSGFDMIDTAPRDGTFIRLRFRSGLGRENWEEIGQWQPHTEMPGGGAWFDREGSYITPGPLFWAPETGTWN